MTTPSCKQAEIENRTYIVTPELFSPIFQRVHAEGLGKVIGYLILSDVAPLGQVVAQAEESAEGLECAVAEIQHCRERGECGGAINVVKYGGVPLTGADELIDRVVGERVRPLKLTLIFGLIALGVEDGVDRIGDRSLQSMLFLDARKHPIIVPDVPIHTAGDQPVVGHIAGDRR